ncbi:MAG: hypothetical protein CME17_05295 [Gemmatimonadetes bacterium]|nr:hypothetical protein [Gemmatimonadota bacterium]|tara:strand:+ start:1102 stop:1704 length:603 start_codon:yes stop_codon:yes gene_type:complete
MRLTHRTNLMLLAGLAFSLVAAASLEGQRGRRGGGRRGPPPPSERSGLEQRVRVRMDQMIRQELDLNEDEWKAVGDNARDFDMKRRELMRSEQALKRRVEAIALEGGANDEEAGEILDQLIALREQELQLFQEEQERLLEILSPSQLVRFQNMREKLGEQIRRLRSGREGLRPSVQLDGQESFWDRDPSFNNDLKPSLRR